MNRQDTVLELSRDLLRVRVVGQGEAANEAAVGSFDAVVALVFFFEFALTGDGENPFSTVTLTSCFFIAGSSALTTYSLSSSVMSATGDQSATVRPSRPFP